MIWLGKTGETSHFTQSKKGNTRSMLSISFETKQKTVQVQLPKDHGEWFADILQKLSVSNNKIYTLQEIKDSYETAGLEDFELFWDNKPISTLYKVGLLRL